MINWIRQFLGLQSDAEMNAVVIRKQQAKRAKEEYLLSKVPEDVRDMIRKMMDEGLIDVDLLNNSPENFYEKFHWDLAVTQLIASDPQEPRVVCTSNSGVRVA